MFFRRTIACAVFVVALILTASILSAAVYSYGKDSTLVGFSKSYTANDNESLIEIARKFDLGYNEITDANAALDPFVPGEGALVRIPSAWILPEVEQREGIVINLSEMRLYYFFSQKEARLVRTFPIGIGSEGNDTPVGIFKIVEKMNKPSWHVPLSIKKEKPELPDVVPPGPDNPLGSHALRLSLGSYLIHGTNKPWAVGRRATHGCIRLYPEDIPVLFRLVASGARVSILRQPVKVGTKNGKVFVEVHREEGLGEEAYVDQAIKLLQSKGLLSSIDADKLYEAVMQKTGMPVDISGQGNTWVRTGSR